LNYQVLIFCTGALVNRIFFAQKKLGTFHAKKRSEEKLRGDFKIVYACRFERIFAPMQEFAKRWGHGLT
jgi:hypothetical protein